MRIVALCTVLTLAVLLGLAHLALTDPKPIQILKSPNATVLLAPATIRLQVRIQPIASDRCVILVADSADFYRRSDWTIAGADAPRLSQPIELRDLPAGEYVLSAGIGSADQCEHLRARVDDRLLVTGPENDAPSR